MRDESDTQAGEPPSLPIAKKRGRPPTGKAKPDARRKRDQRERQAAAIQSEDSSEWNEAECLAVLNGSRWRGGAIDKGAWLRLGKLRGYLS